MLYFTFDLDLGVTCNVAQYPLHNVTYAPADFEIGTCEGFGDDAFTYMNYLLCGLGVKVT